MAKAIFNALPHDEVARNYYAAICGLVDSGTFDDMQHAADRVGVTLARLEGFGLGNKVPPSILRNASKRFGINPCWLHLGMKPMSMPREKVFQIIRMLII